MDIRRFAKPYQWQGATLWFLPYQALPCDVARFGLREIEPDIEYVNTKTGERVIGDEPEALTKAKEKALKLNAPLKTDWAARGLWGSTHVWFWLYLPSIVAVDFPDFDDSTPLSLRMFSAYWNDPGKTIAERWKLFTTSMPSDFLEALILGYESTRDNPAPSKPEMGQGEPDDPKGEPIGSESEPNTNNS